MIYDTLAKEVSAAQQGRSTLEQFVLVPTKLGSFCSGKELIPGQLLQTV